MTPPPQDDSLGLLDRPVSSDLLAERTAELARPKTLAHRGEKSAVIFRLGGEWFALATGVFEEVAENRVLHSLPHHRGGLLKGLINVRGTLMLCISLEALLGPTQQPAASKTASGRVIAELLVCKRDGGQLAFPVDGVAGVVRYNEEDLRPVPATLASAKAGAFTTGVLPWNGKMAGCLDDQLLFYAVKKGLA
ncbi:MAG TPA: chemotaxis protein CheW [Bryobacteraceae bacterium]|nr:chemotaxis protein CheW [Bryobacteraceae bacterium]